MGKEFTKTIEFCQQCPHYRSDRYDPNPDVGMGRGSWCSVTMDRISDATNSPRFNGTMNTVPLPTCPLPNKVAYRLRNKGLL